MSILVYKSSTFDKYFPKYNLDTTLVLSTTNRRYRSSFVRLVQSNEKDPTIFTTAIDSFYANIIILDLFDHWTKLIPKTIEKFLDDYDDQYFDTTQLILILDDEKLIDRWELENVIKKFENK